MKQFMQRHAAKFAGAIAGAVGFAAPLAMHAQSSGTGGAVLPAATFTTFLSYIGPYFLNPTVATIFQSQVIAIMVLTAGLGMVIGLIFMIVRRFRHPGR